MDGINHPWSVQTTRGLSLNVTTLTYFSLVLFQNKTAQQEQLVDHQGTVNVGSIYNFTNNLLMIEVCRDLKNVTITYQKISQS